MFDKIVSAGLDFASAEYFRDKASDEATQNREFSHQEAISQREWQERMRGSQYQTAVSDLKAAGLNPMLAYQHGGAGVPSGGMATPSSAAGVSPSAPSEAILRSQIGAQSAAQVSLLEAQASKTRAEEQEIVARTPTYAVQMDKLRQDVAESVERMQVYAAQAFHSTASAEQALQNTANLRAMIPHIQASIRQLQSLANLQEGQLRLVGSQIGKTEAEMREIVQRVKANLPEAQRGALLLENYARELEQPRREQEAAVHNQFTGAVGAVLRILNPLNSFLK